MNKLIALIIASVLSAFALFFAPAPAIAADTYTPGCVQYAEYDKIVVGDRRTFVHKTFETSGWVTAYYPNQGVESRYYSKCNNPDNWVQMVYERGADGIWRVGDYGLGQW